MHSLKKAHNFWKEHKVAIVGWGVNQDSSHLEEVYKLNIRTGMQLMTIVDNTEQGKEIIKRHEERMAG